MARYFVLVKYAKDPAEDPYTVEAEPDSRASARLIAAGFLAAGNRVRVIVGREMELETQTTVRLK